MGKTIYISDELYDYLNKKFLGYSMDTTIKKLLHLETFQGKIVNKQVPRDRLAPIEKYYWPILNSINLPRKDMQRWVENYLFTTGHFDQYPDELNKLKNLKYEQKYLYGEDVDYIMMTNRVLQDGEDNILSNVTTCFEKFKGEDLITVERNGLILSTLRKKL